jgi:hypothetical protein
MTFDETTVSRATDGRFAEKQGSKSEVHLGTEAPHGHVVFKDTHIGWRLNNALSPEDVARIHEFVHRNRMSVTAKVEETGDGEQVYTKLRYRLTGGRVIKASGPPTDEISPQRAVAQHIYDARLRRDSLSDDQDSSRDEQVARELFGDEYDALVNPTRPKLSLRRLLFG